MSNTIAKGLILEALKGARERFGASLAPYPRLEHDEEASVQLARIMHRTGQREVFEFFKHYFESVSGGVVEPEASEEIPAPTRLSADQFILEELS